MRHRHLFAKPIAALATVWVLAPQIALAATFHDFDDPGTSFELYRHQYVCLDGSSPCICMEPDDPSDSCIPSFHPPLALPGGFLRLAHGTEPPHRNSLSFVRTHFGPACEVVADFDFRMTPGTGRADGMGFALLDTGLFNPIATRATPGDFVDIDPMDPIVPLMEEPYFRRSLGFGFDIFQSPEGDPDYNHVSVHFGDNRIAQIDAGPVDLASGNWIHAQITIAAADGTVSIALTPEGGATVVLATDLAVPGLAPYESRAWFGARSGGLTADHDVDNVQISYSSCPPQDYGEWSQVLPWPLVAIHAHVLPTGEVMFWDRHDVFDGDPVGAAAAQRQAEAGEIEVKANDPIVPRIWDPQDGTFRETAAPPFDLFCSGHTQLADGRLFVAGGHIQDQLGLNTAAIYDPWADCWEEQPMMAEGRWYPTATTLPNGNVLVTSGDIDTRDPATARRNEIPEVWQVFTRAWRELTGAQKEFDYYPFMFVTPDGRVLKVGWEPEAELLDPSGTGSWTPVATAECGHRNYGSAVLLADGRAMIVGGVDPPTACTELLDLTGQPPAWTRAADMHFKRRHLVATLLPDGTVLVTGGTSQPGFNDATGAVHSAEVYDPVSDTWSILAPAAERRIYHSTALLLPDARVLVAGSGHPNDGESDDQSHFNAEIFRPPYLFRGPRPVIASAPAVVRTGETFTVETPSAVDDVTWLHSGSVTHAFNQNQRINRLSFTATAGGIEVTAPATSELAPPGYYMLFLLSDQGVPSEAAFVKLLSTTVFTDGFETGDLRAWQPSTGCAP